MALKKIFHGQDCMVCDCARRGPDWDASDLPIVPLLCDGRCEITERPLDVAKVVRYRRYIKEGGKAWSRGVGGGYEDPDTGETPVSDR